jgi:bacteriocin biosynthesis cyclodehydratase domain-containing protein
METALETAMIQKPKIKSFLTIFPIDANTWGLRGGYDELSRLRLRNDQAIHIFGRMLPYLDGSLETEAVLARLADEGVDREDARRLLLRLEEASLLEDADACGLSERELDLYRDQITFFSRYGNLGGARYQAALRDSTVCVVGNGELASCLRRQLEYSGFGRVLPLSLDRSSAGHGGNGNDNGSAVKSESDWLAALESAAEAAGVLDPLPSLFFVPQESHDPVLLETMDAFSKRHHAAWMLLRILESNEGWVGPLFIPNETACYRSLEARFRANLAFFPEHQAFERHLRTEGRSSASCGGLRAFGELLASIAVVEAVKHVTGTRISSLASRFLTVNLLSWEIEAHDVLRLPRLGLETMNGPVPLGWKEMPHDATEAQRENELKARRG